MEETSRLIVEEPRFTQVPDSLLLNPNISDGAYRLYAVLKHHARQKDSAWPRRRTLATMLGVRSARTVDARIAELVAAGYLVVTPQFLDRGGQTSNLYRLLFHPRKPGDPTPPNGSPDPLQETALTPVQEVAPHPGNDLHTPQATDCTGPLQLVANQRNTYPRNTPTPNPTPAVAPDTHDPEGKGEEVAAPLTNGVGLRLVKDPTPDLEAFTDTFLGELPNELWPRNELETHQIRGLLEPLQVAGWTPRDLALSLTRGRPLPEHVTHPLGLLRSRLEQLPSRRLPTARPDWCGECETTTRLINLPNGMVNRCPSCHPNAHRETS